ncbi:udp-n-acetylglucosamine transferase subunit alg13 homolog [Stylonychia lemnae]|uniref:UDP-N-acetylglucosamine transferase subunit ALG13 n=1 Tax=Stylonychia lemnae TaxID=5949 RepID=A0A078A826_STYLE|nr:udp-n-acetylglucosamine transferase subunit alg13 homolog [Stylonychia lemnae]|eukprot:CDW78405.1 udp-n-acetylglucosamine transferase subunit alg13 homolog [Stylonychia lemnae]
MEKIKRCLIAVGSTNFDELISAIDNKQFIQQQNYRGEYVPSRLQSEKIKVQIEKFIVLDTLIYESDLVISHCGAGILLECLRSDHAICIAVVNNTLMHNHQTELADQLSKEGYIFQATPQTIADKTKEVIEIIRNSTLKDIIKQYPKVQENLIVNLIDEILF